MHRASNIPKIGVLLLCLGAVAVGWGVARKRARPAGSIPRTGDEIAAAAEARGLTIPPACEPGVAANLALLAEHAARLRA